MTEPVVLEREWFIALMAAVDDLAEAALEAALDPGAVLASMEQLAQVLSRHDEAILA